FEIVFDQYLDENGDVVKTGEVSYVSLTLSGETLELYQFTPSSGVWDFFNPNGESVRKALMRTPIDGARLTSGFGMRKHPTLGYNKMHRGVDFGAPSGTPIYAAGDGTIESIGDNGGYGNYIRIRHNSEYSTAYAHMNGFAKGLNQGDRVRQGDIIGYVGTTGRSTGPHLHYEVLVAGEQVNPLDIKWPAGEKLAGADLEDFFAARDVIVALRDTLRRGEQMLVGSQGTDCYTVAEERSC
ncbi:MAG: M23 family metallopeptidase, partial [Dongiaceae bacterium]